MTALRRPMTIVLTALAGFVMVWLFVTNQGSADSTTPKATAAQLASLKASAPDEQQAALADGAITVDEYLAAANAQVTCMRTAGLSDVTVRDPEWVGDQLQTPFSSIDVAQFSVARTIYQGCHEKHFRAVASLWAGFIRPRTAQEQMATLSLVAECFQTNGAPAPTDFTFKNVMESGKALDPATRFACLQQSAG